MIRLKRVYEEPAAEDGQRILVERLWPRGLSREQAALDGWMKELAPSSELRQWYSHDRSKWEEFRRRYRSELEGQGEALQKLEALVQSGTVTFVFASRDEQCNSAVALKEYLESRSGQSSGQPA